MDPSEIQCCICHRPSTTRLPFNCTICARNALYEPRLQHAHILLQKEVFSEDVEKAVAAAKQTSRAYAASPRADSELSDSARRMSISITHTEQTKVIHATQIISDHMQTLRKEVSSMRLEIAKRKARLHQRRSALMASRAELSQRHTNSSHPTEIDAVNIRKQWDAVHDKTMDSGVVLGREVAGLLGLQQRKRKKGVSRRDLYFLGGNAIPDLRDLNSRNLNNRPGLGLTNLQMPPQLKPQLLLLVLHTSFILCLIIYLFGCQQRSRFLIESILYPPFSSLAHRTSLVRFHFRAPLLNRSPLTVLSHRGLVIRVRFLIHVHFRLAKD